MKPFSRIIAFLFLALALVSCGEDVPVPVPEPGGPDSYVGIARKFTFGPEVTGFVYKNYTLRLKAPDGSLISRPGSHQRSADVSEFTLDTGLADGDYEMLYLEYATAENSELADMAADFPTAQFGLGVTVRVKGGAISVLDKYDSDAGMFGEGTKENPYKIESYHHLIKLARYVNSEETNSLITPDTYFVQTVDIDMYQASLEVDRRYGWLPIGSSSTRPFRGHYEGRRLTHILIDRPHTAGVGLFGFVHNASFSGVKVVDSQVSGNFAVGALVGASLMSGTDRGLVSFTDCRLEKSEILGSEQSVSVGALAGHVDMNSRAFMQDCASADNKITATYNAGGLLGGCGLFSLINLNSCTNTSSVRSDFSGAGGIVGSCDTVFVADCHNSGRIEGAAAYKGSGTAIGAGGLVGGAGPASISSSDNAGEVSGHSGVGGLLGSTRVKGGDGDAYMYGNVMLRYCSNTGDISGTDCVGGIVGESQTGCYAVYNTGAVSGTRYVAGIAGNTTVAVAHNAVNTGAVSGRDYVGGILGKTAFGSVALDHNYGQLTASGSHLGGIVALAGNNTVMHYCGNYGKLDSRGGGPVGGLVGEVGDPRKWTGMNYAECVVGALEIGMGLFGPVIAISEHLVEGSVHALAIFLKVSEIVLDGSLLVTDTALLGVGVGEMITEEEVEQLSEEVNARSLEVNKAVKSAMSSLRGDASVSLDAFDPKALTEGYTGSVESTLGYYETEGNDEKFNEMINIAREEREEQLEKSHKTSEIIHSVVAGVCIVCGTVAAVGGAVLSGGAAVPFIVAGSVASVAGGLNAITKSVNEFEENVVLISQCVNAGDISAASGDAGGLVGRLQDASILRDCINTADGPGFGTPFAGHSGHSVDIYRVISLGDHKTWKDYGFYTDISSAVVYEPGATRGESDNSWYSNRVIPMDVADIAKPSRYTDYVSSWKIGVDETSLWKFGSDASNTFPVPSYSEMRK